MPKINRLRIVNFSYNNNNRHIIDECFDFYGGENSLLSLANGGGKSVLVQAMLQPILPKVSLLGRKFGDFFSAKRTPSYIMIEWMLEDEAGYLLTGIAVTSKITHSTEEEEQNSDIRYFTFLKAYEKADNFDIKHIPVTEQTGHSVKIASYNEFKKLLQKESVKPQSELYVFDSTREDQQLYDKKLNSFSISREEWKELMVKINEAEHGVSEVFTECKTSRKVMEQWVIKYIEKVLDKSNNSDMTDHKKLETMMAQVAQSLVDNENHIKEYEAIQRFSGDIDTLGSCAKEVLSNLDDEDKLSKEIVVGYQVLKNEEERFEEELAKIKVRNSQISEELELVRLEEKSQEYYGYCEQIDAASEKLSVLKVARDEKEKQSSDEKYRLNLQKASERYSKILEKEKAMAELRQRFENASKDQEELNRNLNRVKYSLKLAYGQLLEQKNSDLKQTDEKLKTLSDVILKNKDEAKKCQSEIEKLKQVQGVTNRDIEVFEKEEAAILEKLNIQIYRNPLLKELDVKEINKVEAELLKEHEKAVKLLNDKNNKIQELKVQVNELAVKKEVLLKIQADLKVQEAGILANINAFEVEKQKTLDAMGRFDIAQGYLFDRNYLMKAGKEYLTEWENKVYHLKTEINDLVKQILGFEKGMSYLPASLMNLLDKHNVPCYTGEKYLRETDVEQKLKLLEKNPLLPYSLLVTEKELGLLVSISSDIELGQVVPVIRYSQLDAGLDLSEQNVQFIANSKTIAMDAEQIGAYVNELMEMKEKKLLELDKTEQVIERINSDYQILAGFSWTKQIVDKLIQDKKGNEEELNNNEGYIGACVKEIEASNRKIDVLGDEVKAGEKAVEAEEARIEGFRGFLVKNSEYVGNLKKLNEIISSISRVADAKSKHVKDTERLETEQSELKSLLEEIKRALKEIESKLLQVSDAQADMVEDGVGAEIGDGARAGDHEDRSYSENPDDLGIIDIHQGLMEHFRSKGTEVSKAVQDKEYANKASIGIAARISTLEGRLKAYKNKQSNNVSELDERIKGLISDIKRENKQIEALGLNDEEYKNVMYSEALEAELQSLLDNLGKEIDYLKVEYTALDKDITSLNTKREMAVRSLGENNTVIPIDKIKGNFKQRRSVGNNEISQNLNRVSKIDKDKIELAQLIGRVSSEVKQLQYIKATEKVEKTFEEVKSSISILLGQYNDAKKKSEKSITSFGRNSSAFANMYSQYEEGTIKDALRSLKVQMEALDRSYEKFYYLTERMEYYLTQLMQILKIMETKMVQLQHSKKDLTEHAFMEAKRIYHEIPKISENSAVEIDGVRKRVLEIHYEEMEDEVQAREKMGNYIEECLQTLTKLIKENEDDSRLRRDLEKYMSTKELLNVISRLENCRVRAYKVDLNEKNRRMMAWEDIIVKNSGGEKFVAYFSLLVALISYSRKQLRGYDAFKNKEESKVLIMDNPFGPITSGHLLKPMFDIAEKYNTQLICLSDIKQGSVINSFDLIYMVKIRQNMMQEDYLELEPIMLKELKQDEKLEKAYFYTKQDQMSLFE